jgi:alpha-beta hydrolase superfamily lysophospholipase
MPDTDAPAALWNPPAAVRGALAVIAGRDESARVYERFGRRISADGYTVAVFELADAAATVPWLGDQGDIARVLVGSDAGAAAVLSALVRRVPVDAAIVAGTPVGSDAGTPAASDRTACPVHLGVLAEPAAHAATGADAAPLPDRDALAFVTVPVLAVHGGADPIADADDTAAYLAALPDLTLIETVDGLHDALNDQTHRSVAAHIVLWLERLRGGDVRRPLVRERTATGVSA